MPAQQFVDWQEGKLIQYAAPQLTATQREQLISAICPACQGDFFDEE